MEGHFGRPVDRPFFGQLLHVQRTGGVGLPPNVRTLDTIVIVPWDYDAGCQPVPWSQSYHWLREPGVRFFSVALRDSGSWYRGLPTFDAYAPENAAYPPAFASPVYGRQGSSITPEELFDFYEAMPAQEDAGAPGALTNARKWVERHQAEADRYPLQWVVEELLNAAAYARAEAFVPPMRGTYRITLVLPDGSQRISYARTREHPTGPYYAVNQHQSGPRWSWDNFSEGCELWLVRARTVDSLRAKWFQPGDNDIRAFMRDRASFPWHIAWAPDSMGKRWPATIDPWEFFPVNPREPAMDTLYDHLGEVPGLWSGAFTLGPGDAAHFEESIPVKTGGVMTVKADRLSLVTVVDSTH